jgi:long-chain acyl-CoA synthetase
MQFKDGNVADTMLAGGEVHAPAILYGDGVMTYGELRGRVQRAASVLQDCSEKGECIGLLAENSFFHVISYLGTMHAGRVTVPLPNDISPEMLTDIVASTRMKTIFVSRGSLMRYKPLLEELGLHVIGEADFFGDMPEEEMPDIDPVHDLAAIMFTSGSTGVAKGVMVTHRNIECNTRDIVSYLGLTEQDRVMAVLPFHYCFGASLLHTHLMAGGSVVMNNQFMYPETVLDAMEKRECTGLAGVPSSYQILLRRSTFRQRSFPKLRWFQQAGGKLADPFIQEIQQSFPRAKFYLMYGQTEATARLSYLPPDRLQDKLGSIGKGLPSTLLQVLKEDGEPVVPGSDELGEIVASGDNITKGYWNDPEETGRYFREGKLYTGDMARVDADGFIFVQDRARDFIKTGGNRVGSKELENVIAQLSEVVEVAVIGVPHDILGEAIKAFVVVTRGSKLTRDDIRKHCRKELVAYKVPEMVEFIQSLPKNSAGKVMKPQLRSM